NPEELVPDCDFLVVLGGDGSLIGVARQYAKFKKPILGINFGRLGYLVELEKNDISKAECLINGKYRLENRIMLDVKVVRNGKPVFFGTALNDAVVTKGALSKMIHFKMSVDNHEVNSYHADGLIVATPTGSTAYSMSAGGPVVAPELEVMVLTPICSHSLNSKPVVVSDKQTIRIDSEFRYEEEVVLTLDGQEGFRLTAGDYVEITKSENTAQLVRITERSFFYNLQQKLNENR
ncbi:MAG: NAD(+)/NADH kinase, partial [Clostridia bacterium]|nr:NAD(+)/NADH kinase [Clostridia bacterium]